MRTRSTILTTAAGLVLAAFLAACAGGADDPAPTERAAPVGWPLPGGNLDNSRSTDDTTWSTATVGGAKVAWETELPDAGGLPTVPIIVDGVVYVQGTRGAISAVDLETGHVRWSTKAEGFNIGPTGVAVADGRVFGLHGSTGVVAVDAEDGHELWTRDIVETPTTGIDIQPVVHDGLVLVSTVPVSIGGIYTGGDRGVIHALDAATGAERWTFDTVQGPDLWGHPEINSGGGAWYPPAIDPDAGLAYFGIANPAPFPGVPGYPNGTSRPGPNLYTDSVVALDLETGALRWYRQATSHDLFDRDQIMAMVARTDDGPVVISSGKSGVVLGVDPATGDERWRTEVGHHENDDLTELPGPTTVYPGTYGGVLTPPATSHGTVYLPVVNAPAELKPAETAYFGAALGTEDGEVDALDARTGKARWRRKVPGDPLGGVTVLGDLLVVPLVDGHVLGLDRGDGRIVWRATLPGGTNGQPAAAGRFVVFPVGQADPPRLVAYRVERR
jgi:alcohol dehydrogenase (cytochrome c)